MITGPAATEVILHAPDAKGSFSCLRCQPLPASTPAMVSVVPTSLSPSLVGYAQVLVRALSQLLSRIEPRLSTNSCGGPGPNGCIAHRTGTRCVLVLVGDGTAISDYSGALGLWTSKIAEPAYRFLPVAAPGQRTAMVQSLPTSLSTSRVQEWTTTPAEVASDILDAAFGTGERRVFISYRQSDGYHHARDFFNMFSGSGFETFLDEVRIAPGERIQDRIREEIVRSSALLVIETPQIGQSQWVAQEVAIAAAGRLPVLAINLPNGVMISSIGRRRRQFLSSGDVVNDRITDSALFPIIDRVTEAQRRFLLRRTHQMQQALINSLSFRGCSNYRSRAGVVEATPNWARPTTCNIAMTARPAEIDDFRG